MNNFDEIFKKGSRIVKISLSENFENLDEIDEIAESYGYKMVKITKEFVIYKKKY